MNDKRKEKKTTFFQWLFQYELMTVEEFNELPKYKQDNYKDEFDMFKNGTSQYNK